MKTQYSNRPFADEFTGNPVQESLGSFIVRGTSAIGGSVIVTAMLAAILAH